MKNKLVFAILLALSDVLTSFAGASDLVGAWKGPKELMINFCLDNDNNVYVGQCGIFRTFGWDKVVYEINGDSLFLKSTDCGSPFAARFRIVSTDRMTGTLRMGDASEDWYYDGSAELSKEKPDMPVNINQNLAGIVNVSDGVVLSLDRNIALNVLGSLELTAYGYNERSGVERLLEARTYPLTPEDMVGNWRVRSIQIDARDGIFSYPYFKCRFRKENGKFFFEKTTGSQRKSGYVYQNNDDSLIFLGGWSVNDDPQTTYGGPNSVFGTVYKIGPDRAIMIFPTLNDRVEIYELRR